MVVKHVHSVQAHVAPNKQLVFCKLWAEFLCTSQLPNLVLRGIVENQATAAMLVVPEEEDDRLQSHDGVAGEWFLMPDNPACVE